MLSLEKVSQILVINFMIKVIYALFGNIVGTLRYSEYRDVDEVWQHLLRLREFYDVGFYEATYNVEEKIFHFNFDYGNIDIVRVFPMEDYRNTDPDRKLKEYDLGILYVKKDDWTLLEDEEAVFKYIPDKTDGILTREVKPTLVKPANVMGLEEMYEEDDMKLFLHRKVFANFFQKVNMSNARFVETKFQ